MTVVDPSPLSPSRSHPAFLLRRIAGLVPVLFALVGTVAAGAPVAAVVLGTLVLGATIARVVLRPARS